MAGRQGHPPAVLSMAAAGEWGKLERGTRAFHPRAHLRLERREAVDRRRTEGGGGANGGGAVELGGEVVRQLEGGVVRRGSGGDGLK
jgi:hypothetical protein